MGTGYMTDKQTDNKSQGNSPKRILVVDDHPIVRQGIRTAFAEIDRIEIVGEADNSGDAQSAVELLKPDLVMLDIRLKGSRSGIEVATKLKEAHPNLKIVVLTNHSQEPYLRAMIKAGVDGYLLKDTAPSQIVEAVDMVLEGRSVYSNTINSRLVSGYLREKVAGDLTSREAEVLQFVADGMTNEQVSQKLAIGQKGVQMHLTSIYSKLGVSRRTEAVAQGVRKGIVVIDDQTGLG